MADVPLFERWDRQPHVISATTDDPAAAKAFEDAHWPDELAAQDEHNAYLIAELKGRPIGAMQLIDPHLEKSHYWGEIRPNLRAVDIWIGEPDCLGKGYGETMMRLAFQLCFADPAVTAIVIDPLASNERARRFYRRLGFRPIGRRRFGDDDCLVHELTREDWRDTFADGCRINRGGASQLDSTATAPAVRVNPETSPPGRADITTGWLARPWDTRLRTG